MSIVFKTFKKKKKKTRGEKKRKREGEPLFFPLGAKIHGKKRATAAAAIRLHVDTMCNFIIFFRLESHAARKISNWFPLSFTANSWHAGRNLMNFRECKVSAESRELAFSLPVPFLKR